MICYYIASDLPSSAQCKDREEICNFINQHVSCNKSNFCHTNNIVTVVIGLFSDFYYPHALSCACKFPPV